MRPVDIAGSARAVAALRDALLQQFPSLRDDDQALADTLDGMTDFSEMMERLAGEKIWCEALVSGAKLAAQGLHERAARLQAKADKLRAVMESALTESGTQKMTLPSATLSLRRNPRRVIITDLWLLPADYRLPPKPADPIADKDRIKAAIERGEDVPGAELSNPSVSLAFREA